ncbi:hypothetical protein K438DRAFT_1942023 [Mycena galopus ATCC 62051]|nr:hypothetical protein K438DRAFT_1942023 [Mycena galopus ATCC 62051]
MQQVRPRDLPVTPLYPSPRTSWEREQSGEVALSGFFVTEGFKPTPRTVLTWAGAKPLWMMHDGRRQVPELLDYCLSFLAESPSDLRTSGACAPTLETWGFWLLFRDTVEAYPHLICHVRDLRLQTDGEQLAIVTSTVGQICNIPFRHLFNSLTVMQIRAGRNPAPDLSVGVMLSITVMSESKAAKEHHLSIDRHSRSRVGEVPKPDLHFSRFIFPKAKKMSVQGIRTDPTKKILDLQDLNLEWNLRQAADETEENQIL